MFFLFLYIFFYSGFIQFYEEEIKQLAKELGILDLPFTHADTLTESFDEWSEIAHKDINYDKNIIRKQFVNKYSKIFHSKKAVKMQDGPPKYGRGIYGLKFEPDKFKQLKNDANCLSQSSPEKFISYLENLLSAYFLASIPS
jgi:hypothetical protein